MKELDVFLIGLLLLILGLIFGFIIGVSVPADSHEKTSIVCEYQGGTIHDDVCIRNNQVIIINLKEHQ